MRGEGRVSTPPSGHGLWPWGSTISGWLFLRLLGVIYLVAFVSLWPQIAGLIGHDGILPAGQFLEAARQQLGGARQWVVPTLCWLNASDGFLHGLCAGGVLLSLLLILDLAPALSLFLLWTVYLSLVTVGQEFLSFQWDNLLLETGFLAIFAAPCRLGWRGKGEDAPSTMALWLLRWLLFRLMFSSGVVKLASGDPAWRGLTALTYHYETQPLPTWIGWYAHQLPAWFQRFSCGAMFGIELVVPFLIFAPRLWRRAGCALLLGFQALIAATGNYMFFNLLAAALCLLLLDNAAWPTRMQEWWHRRHVDPAIGPGGPSWPTRILVPASLFLLTVSLVPLTGLFRSRLARPGPLLTLYRWIAPFRTVDSYGLFAVMTTSRLEIIVEGSQDGIQWRPYEFTDKPGELRRRPRFVAPHQPRLDWQMWFAALSSYQRNPWFLQFCQRLLEGSPAVLALLARNPFPEAPPRYVRAVVYAYHFTDPATRRAEGTWWRRELKGLYCPVLSLRGR